MITYKKNAFKLLAHATSCLALRFVFNIFLGIPNVEPLYAWCVFTQQHQSYSRMFLFGFSNIVIFDFLTMSPGPWTLITGLTYGLLAVGIARFCKNKSLATFGLKNYPRIAQCTIVATLMYDVFTGILIGPLFLPNQSFLEAAIGQVPFSLLHIMGNLTLVLGIMIIYQGLMYLNKKKSTTYHQNIKGHNHA